MKAADIRDTSRQTERLLAAIHEAKRYAQAHEGGRVTLPVSDLGWLLERITRLEDELAEARGELAWHRGEHEA